MLGYAIELPVKFNLIAFTDLKTLDEFEGNDGTQIFVSSSKQKSSTSTSETVSVVGDLNKTLSAVDLSKQLSDDDNEKLSDKNSDFESSDEIEHNSTIKNSDIESSDGKVDESLTTTNSKSIVNSKSNENLSNFIRVSVFENRTPRKFRFNNGSVQRRLV